MRSKIFRTVLIVSMVVLVLCMSLVMGMVYNFFENSYSIELKNEVHYVASSVEVYGKEYINNVDFGDMRVSYIKSDGTVLYDNRADVNQMSNHSGREEFEEALLNGYGDSVRLSETLSEKTYYIAKRLSNGDVVRVSDTRKSEWTLVSELFVDIILVGLICVILSAIFSGRLARMVVKPINGIDFSQPDNSDVYEELTPLIKRLRRQQRQIAEQIGQLKKEREEFNAITSNLSEGFIIIDTLANILSSNMSAAIILGESTGKSEGSVYNICNQAWFVKCIDTALSGKRETTIVQVGDRYISVLANPVCEDGHVIGAVIILMDVTEREGREKLRREFSANVSHELKTPLTSISVAAEMLAGGMVKMDDAQSFSEKIYLEAQRLINLVNDIIKLSKLDERSETGFERVKIDEIVCSAVNTLSNAAAQKNIEIDSHVESVWIKCVPHLMGEIVYNLLDNAIKYTPEGGKVSVCCEKNGDGVRLSVSDNGIGIAQTEQDRIFERFYRVDKSHTDSDGTGLGLSIVKHAVLIHNGTISVESQLNRGSKFTVVI